METRAENLRRRIDAYRCYLAVGGDIQTVRLILKEVARHEAELAAIANEAKDIEQQRSRHLQSLPAAPPRGSR
jgi:hypothetical protein